MSTATSDICGIGARITQHLAERLGPQKFSLWFDRVAHLKYDEADRKLEVAVPTAFAASGIRRKFSTQLRESAALVVGQEVALEVRVEPSGFTGAPRANACSTATKEGGPRSMKKLRHRLEDFVVGSCNQLAFLAATRLADEAAAASCHPLFFYGDCGVGKTHLLQGVCRRRLEQVPGAAVRYTTGEQFTNDYINALRNGRIEAFRKAIRRLDLLAVDDVHFLGPREKTQDEFLHCFDQIDLAGARVVLASDSHPKLLERFSKPLVNRCVRGMVVQMRPPDLDLRMKLFRVLAQRRGMVLQPSVIDRLAQAMAGSVREIEGLMTKLYAFGTLGRSVNGQNQMNESIGHALVDRVLASEQRVVRCKPVQFEQVLDVVTEQLGVDRGQITGGSRHRHVVLARSLVIYLTRRLTSMSFPEIATAMKRRNHSTIVTAAQRMQKQIDRDEFVSIPGQLDRVTPRQLVERIRREIEIA